jgi:purine-nucleoside phosphorylase
MKTGGVRMLDKKYTVEYFGKAADYLLERVPERPEIALVLGSSLGGLSEMIEKPTVVEYRDIPDFLMTTVQSHAGKLIFGRLAGKSVVCMSGRFHYYEGYDFEQLVTPVRVLKGIGVKTLVLTNAAGGVNETYAPGDIMLISDHIKLMGASPMRGPNIPAYGDRFFDVSDMYTASLREVAKKASGVCGVPIHEGVYFFFPGPQFETPAEVRSARILGGDAVGMSTVTEALTAAHCGMQVLAFSLITNMAAGVLNQTISPEEVGVTARRAAKSFQKLLLAALERLP